jgi:ribonuclease P protein component
MGACRFVPPAQEGTQASHREAPLQAPEPVTSERFPRLGRLTRGADLTSCWEAGRRRRTPHLDLAWRPNPTGRARTGIIVPRYQSSAVARNRLRRRLREILRREVLSQLPPIDLVIRAKRAAYAASFAVLRAELSDATSALQ